MNYISLVIGKTGVGKSSLINGITEGKANCKVSSSKSACTSEMGLGEFKYGSDIFQFLDTPGLDDAKGDENNLNEVKRAASDYKDFRCILLLFNLQANKLDNSTIVSLQKYMEIFPVQYFWEHVLIVYTRSYRYTDEFKEQIENARGEFLKTIKNHKDYTSFRNFMDNKGINIPEEIKEFFVDSNKKVNQIDSETKSEYREILKSIKNIPKMFKNILIEDKARKIDSGGVMKKIQTMRSITYIPRYGNSISLKEFVVPPEYDDTQFTPYGSPRYIRKSTGRVISRKCKKYRIIEVYKINKYKLENGTIIDGNENVDHEIEERV